MRVEQSSARVACLALAMAGCGGPSATAPVSTPRGDRATTEPQPTSDVIPAPAGPAVSVNGGPFRGAHAAVFAGASRLEVAITDGAFDDMYYSEGRILRLRIPGDPTGFPYVGAFDDVTLDLSEGDSTLYGRGQVEVSTVEVQPDDPSAEYPQVVGTFSARVHGMVRPSDAADGAGTSLAGELVRIPVVLRNAPPSACRPENRRAAPTAIAWTESPTLRGVPADAVIGSANGSAFEANVRFFRNGAGEWEVRLQDATEDQAVYIRLGTNAPRRGREMRREMSEQGGGGFFQICESRGMATTSWNTAHAWVMRLTTFDATGAVDPEGALQQQIGTASGSIAVMYRGDDDSDDPNALRSSWVAGTFTDAPVIAGR